MNKRYDQTEIRDSISKTDEGYLRGSAIVTRSGVFEYLNADGSIRRELRHPDEVFSKASLDSLKMIPVTNDHPQEKMVNAGNAAKLAVGYTGETVEVDGKFVITSMTVTHEDGIEAVNAGKRQLSLGYSCDVVDDPGLYNGEAYDAIQKNIRYNHLALVDKARAGESASLKLDSKDAIQVFHKFNGVTNMADKKFAIVTLDGLKYEASPEVAMEMQKKTVKIDSLEEELASLKLQLEKVQAELDEMAAAKADLEEEKKDLEEEKKDLEGEEKMDAAINERVKHRLQLLTKASRVVKEDMSDLNDMDIMKKVITTKHDGLDLSEKSSDYISARFDAIIENLPSVKDPKAIQRQIQKSAEKLDKCFTEDLETKKQDMFQAMKDAYKGVK